MKATSNSNRLIAVAAPNTAGMTPIAYRLFQVTPMKATKTAKTR